VSLDLKPVLYRQPATLDTVKHRTLRFRGNGGDHRLAADMNAMFCAAGEFPDASREYAIVFVPSQGPTPDAPATAVPVVLLGLRSGESLFARADGGWDARYVPAFLRRYPFAYVRLDNGQVGVLFDEAFEGFNESEGERLFDDAGQPTPYFQGIMGFLGRYEEEVDRTRAFCDKLIELDLLKGGEISGAQVGDQPLKLDGFFMVDEQKLLALPDAAVLDLHRSGMLGLINLHLASMGNLPRLEERLVGKLARAAEGAMAA